MGNHMDQRNEAPQNVGGSVFKKEGEFEPQKGYRGLG